MTPGLRRRLRERRTDLVRLTTRRLAAVPPVAGVVTVLGFVLAAVSPLDPLTAHFGGGYEHTTEAERAAASAALGTDVPWWRAWWAWVGGLLRGDAGYSHSHRQPVVELLLERLPWTVLLSAAGLALAVTATLLAGVAAARRPGGILDRTLATSAIVLSGVPTFVLALVSVSLLTVTLRLLPAGGVSGPGLDPTAASVARHLVLPAVVLAAGHLPWMLLAFRHAVTEAADSAPVAEARVRGLAGRTVLTGHVAAVSWTPLIALLGARVPEIIAGSMVVESVFAWPGVAAATVDAALEADFALLAAVTLGATVTVLLATWVADCLLLLSDPRVRIDA